MSQLSLVLPTSRSHLLFQAEDNGTVFQDSETYLLFLTAYLLSPTGVHAGELKSPRAVLDVHVGSNDELAAPEWTRWSKPTLVFYQPRASFADLFAWISSSDYNCLAVRNDIPDIFFNLLILSEA
jgi:hypothetical protein